ncbi:zinc-binding dehydrogenase [Microbacterium timonense]|uniref:zinc-binding dehydrogenase n=1 Tax=Microbacterium timonense TaxID=2086576 RepID=UPI000D0FF8BA|nr:zinc-binding dehydrogenase [Microbacterium timonense]
MSIVEAAKAPTGSPASVGAGDPDFEEATDRLIERAKVLIPTLRARAQEAEALRYQPPQTVKDAEFLMDSLTPRVWGGQGLGSRALCEVSRVLAHGDTSAAWTLAFLIEHSWMAAHLPWKAQEELFKDRTFILAAAPLTPAGKAEKVEGGFRVSGTFRYASGLWNSDYTFCSSIVSVDGVPTPTTFLVPLAQPGVTVNDDWFMSGMAATGSASVTMDDVFVPEHYAVPLEQMLSIDKHPGIVHEEKFLRYPPYASLGMMITAIALGSAEAVVDIVKSRLATTRAFGGAMRSDLPQSRMRFAQAWEKLRCAQLLYKHILEESIRKSDALEPWSQQEIGQIELDQTTIVHLAQELIGILCDGMGSSPYQTKEALQRYRRDIDVIANHAFMDWDLVGERSIRYVLGLGTRSTDMFRSQVTSQKSASDGNSAEGTTSEEKLMKAAVLSEVAGTPAVGEFAAPVPEPGEQVAEVIVAALNPIDLRLAAGGPFGPPVVPSVVGTEGVARLEDGTKVYFSDSKPPYGALGEKVLLGDRSRVYPIPDGLDEGLAAALGTSGVIALTGLQWRAQVRPGDEVLILGVTGAVGQIGAQAARLLGAGRVIGAARNVEVLEALKSKGVLDDYVVLTGGEGDAAAIKESAAIGFDVVLDAVMGPAFAAALPATKIGARYVVVGMSGGQPATTIAYPFLTGRSVFGHLKPLVPLDEWEASYQQLAGWANAGQLSLEVERVPFDSISEVWGRIDKSPHKKLVVEM